MTQVRHRIVEFIFGAQWQSVVPVLRVMAVFSLMGSIGVNIGDVYGADVTVVTGQHYELADLPHSFAVEPRIRPWKAVETLWERTERSA